MKKILLTSFSALILTLAAGAFSGANAQTISGSVGAVARGGSAQGSVVMSIPGDRHVNSNRPNSEFAIPTTVSVSATGAKAGSVSYPRGRSRKFSFSETPLNVYEGRAVFGFKLSVPANFKGNSVKVRAVVKFQACTNEVCYAPKTQEVTLTAKVK